MKLKTAKEKLNKTVQKDIFFDFKKRIIFSLIIVGIFLLLAIYNLFISSPLINILLVIIASIGITMLLFSARKLDEAKKSYEQAGIELIERSKKQ